MAQSSSENELGSVAAAESITILKKLGQGQFGSVHLAETSSGELRAVKRIKVARMRSQKDVQNLDREIKLLKEHRHPNIVRLYGVKRHSDEFWLILEYCGGGDLQQFIRAQTPKPRLAEPVARGFFQQITSGIVFMAERGLVHRDLKPANLLLSEAAAGAALKIADFGFARPLAGDNLALTQCGSPLYMAPEILAGQPHDYKVDIYSAGVILFEMLVGKTPFTGRDVPDLIKNQRRDLIMKVHVTPPCLELIGLLLQRQPIKRACAQCLAAHPWVQNQGNDCCVGPSGGGAAAASGAEATSPPPLSSLLLSPSSSLEGVPPATETLPVPPSGVSRGGAAVGAHNRSEEGASSNNNGSGSSLSESVASSGWEMIPSKSLTVAEALRQKALTRQKELLLSLSRIHEGGESDEETDDGDGQLKSRPSGKKVATAAADLQGVREVMEYSRRAAEHFGACGGKDDEADAVLEELHEFLRHPAVDAALARSALPPPSPDQRTTMHVPPANAAAQAEDTVAETPTASEMATAAAAAAVE